VKFAKIAIIASLPVVLSGCTVVSYNRTFPKISWYWSKDAQEQRSERDYYKVLNAQDEHWADSVTNLSIHATFSGGYPGKDSGLTNIPVSPK